MTEQKFLTIGQVSQRTGLSIDTIRYYEKIGLLPEIQRSDSGLRQFQERDVAILGFIHCFRVGGMSIERLKAYMTLVQESDHNLDKRLVLLREEKRDLEQRLLDLQSALRQIDGKITNYEETLMLREQELFSLSSKERNED